MNWVRSTTEFKFTLFLNWNHELQPKNINEFDFKHILVIQISWNNFRQCVYCYKMHQDFGHFTICFCCCCFVLDFTLHIFMIQFSGKQFFSYQIQVAIYFHAMLFFVPLVEVFFVCFFCILFTCRNSVFC